jgi:hypothetical protein
LKQLGVARHVNSVASFLLVNIVLLLLLIDVLKQPSTPVFEKIRMNC